MQARPPTRLRHRPVDSFLGPGDPIRTWRRLLDHQRWLQAARQ
jgi:hypothetical protein